MTLLRVASLMAVLVTASAVSAHADEAHVLPFWGQPYPFGYVRAADECVVERRVATARGWRTVWLDRCRPVLHARD